MYVYIYIYMCVSMLVETTACIYISSVYIHDVIYIYIYVM